MPRLASDRPRTADPLLLFTGEAGRYSLGGDALRPGVSRVRRSMVPPKYRHLFTPVSARGREAAAALAPRLDLCPEEPVASALFGPVNGSAGRPSWQL